MKPHAFVKPEYGSACAHKEVRETQLPAPLDKSVNLCWRAEEHPMHWVNDQLNKLYDELYDLEHDENHEAVAERLKEVEDKIAELKGKS
jgi:hypothetical protein